ncbi:questin oxidase family protein [Lichenihabitans sp. Uapishka_5]|uniref:questin oxidase family protein n=1 Tax=Lichenihabitans sp. Uapishka_5 TaxID=3037302 RepID=UPI0029E7FACC|nr:questin oxidase family protein [Lichenihabitans sp. Uapishka_5]MDX7953424.1 questin oxidase family protein [Lichenihabitans sp. Uapishka_5]
MTFATMASRDRPSLGLDSLLQQARRHSAEFPDVLANHLPMILVALDRLGASPERKAAFLATYRDTKGLVATPDAVGPIDAASWTTILGDRTRETDARAFFTGEVARLGIQNAVSAYLPRLAPGVAGSALHPLMRLAYGVLQSDPAEVGTALGYWACCYLPLPPSTGATPETDDPGVVLARVTALPGLRALPAYDHLWHAIRATAADPDFAQAVDWLRIDAGTPARVAATSLALYAATMDFAALHAVTGAHWVRVVSGVCPDPGLLRCFWQAVAALVPSIGFPTLPDAAALETWRHLPCPDWAAIKATAVASDDEHDISLVFSANEEEKIYGDRLYRVVAARRVGLIP